MDWKTFSKEELKDAINQYVDKINIGFDQEKNEHLITIKFKLALVKDSIDYKDPYDKSKGYKFKEGKEELKGNLPIPKRGRYNKINAPLHHHSTVTLLARLRGLSTSVPLATAT